MDDQMREYIELQFKNFETKTIEMPAAGCNAYTIGRLLLLVSKPLAYKPICILPSFIIMAHSPISKYETGKIGCVH
ncbi:hypothetical protein BLOT_005451 [Blomia tropicalis]|nr:hypothetical protein BLOT_005451 [Blomia tropicalis]